MIDGNNAACRKLITGPANAWKGLREARRASPQALGMPKIELNGYSDAGLRATLE